MANESNVLPLSMELEVEHIMREVKRRFSKLKKPKDRIGEWVFMRDAEGFTEYEVATGRERISSELRHVFYCHFLPEAMEEHEPWIVLSVLSTYSPDRLHEGIMVCCATRDGRQVAYASILKMRKRKPPKMKGWERVKADSAFFEIMTDIFNGDSPCKSERLDP